MTNKRGIDGSGRTVLTAKRTAVTVSRASLTRSSRSAIGAPAGRLVRSLIVQVVLILGAGLALGIALYTPLSQQRIGGLPLRFETNAVIFWVVVLLVLGVLSSLLAARRVLRIDPIEATTGAGVGR